MTLEILTETNNTNMIKIVDKSIIGSPFNSTRTLSKDMVEDEIKLIHTLTYDDQTTKVVNKVQVVVFWNVLIGYGMVFTAMIISAYAAKL
mmetsp:Transcript_23978/g.26247  ORF Transcript_23978/g.26247 Transcript_23978/m.26247 type:complete len:90 (-) Transcript_23978:770-1039(-)